MSCVLLPCAVCHARAFAQTVCFHACMWRIHRLRALRSHQLCSCKLVPRLVARSHRACVVRTFAARTSSRSSTTASSPRRCATCGGARSSSTRDSGTRLVGSTLIRLPAVACCAGRFRRFCEWRARVRGPVESLACGLTAPFRLSRLCALRREARRAHVL